MMTIGIRARIGTGILCAAALATALAGCSGASPTPRAATTHPAATTASTHTSPPQAGCPTVRPAVSTGSRPNLDATSPIVPFTPNRAELCRYAGLNPPAGKHRFDLLVNADLGATDAAALASEINHAAKPFPNGTTVCPNDTGDEIDVYFATPGQSSLRVKVALTGCQSVSTSHAGGAIGLSGLIAKLESLVPVK